MRENFVEALAHVLRHEGGFVNHPSDPGGATNKGVTLAVFRRFYGKSMKVQDLKNITDEQLQHIYRVGYWDKCQCDELPPGVDYCVFDGAVNSGPGRAAKWLQGAVGASQDGGIRPNTLAKVAITNPFQIVTDMCDRRMQFLKGLSTWQVFGKGWGRRVDEVRHKAMSLVGGVKPEIELVLPNIQFETVKLGDKGKWVSRLQSALEIDVDGVFGKVTERTLMIFQSVNGLEVDGVAGRDTWRALGLLP